MELIIENFGLSVRKVKGKNEFEIYKNYVKEIGERKLELCFNTLFDERHLKQKNNSKAISLRKEGNKLFTLKTPDFDVSLRLYTRSLCYSTYNNEEYAMALANRSAVYFAMEKYESSIIDVDLCLKADYPKNLKPKVIIRKARCLKKMGNTKEMRKTLMDALDALDGLPKLIQEKYKKAISSLIIAKADKVPPVTNTEVTSSLPAIEENPSFASASSSVGFRYDRKKGHKVFAKNDIKRGDVLFVEKAFAFAPVRFLVNVQPAHTFSKPFIIPISIPKSCQYCLTLLSNCIPCKTCVKHGYCNEQCRDSAWTEFHQWECLAVRADVNHESNHGYLALRIIFKALTTGFSMSNFDFQQAKEYGNKEDNYTFVYNLPRNIHKMEERWLKLYAATAAFWTHYLKRGTDFFKHMKELPNYTNRNEKELMNQVGALIIRHCAQLHTNTIPVKMIDEASFLPVLTAIAVCPSATLMNHACVPNTAHYFINDVVIVKATEDIKANKEIFRSYTSAVTNFSSIELSHADADDRKRMLKDLCFLKCDCKACVDPKLSVAALNAYLCPRCKGPAITNTGERVELLDLRYQCLDCNHKCLFAIDMLVKDNMAEQFLIRFKMLGNIVDAHMCLDIAKNTYVSTHPVFLSVTQELCRYYLARGNVKDFLVNADKLLLFCKKRRTNLAVETALSACNLAKSGITILKQHGLFISIQDFCISLLIITRLLNEARDVLLFYDPRFICSLDPYLDSIRELRILHVVLIANQKN